MAVENHPAYAQYSLAIDNLKNTWDAVKNAETTAQKEAAMHLHYVAKIAYQKALTEVNRVDGELDVQSNRIGLRGL
jgi:hypothetical protein